MQETHLVWGENVLSDEACIKKLKPWLIKGYELPRDLADGRKQHVKMNIRQYRELDDAELDRQLARLIAGDE